MQPSQYPLSQDPRDSGDTARSVDGSELGGRWARLEPSIMLPAQFFHGTWEPLAPEKRLMLAVLESAVTTLLGRGRTRTTARRRAVREVEEWLASGETDSPFAFVRICEALGLDDQ